MDDRVTVSDVKLVAIINSERVKVTPRKIVAYYFPHYKLVAKDIQIFVVPKGKNADDVKFKFLDIGVKLIGKKFSVSTNYDAVREIHDIDYETKVQFDGKVSYATMGNILKDATKFTIVMDIDSSDSQNREKNDLWRRGTFLNVTKNGAVSGEFNIGIDNGMLYLYSGLGGSGEVVLK